MKLAVVLVVYLIANAVVWLLRHKQISRAKRKGTSLDSDYPLTDLDPLPTVSMLVAARNESGNVERCLTSLLDQNYEHLDLIAIDDRSEDDTGRIMARLAGDSDGRLRVLAVSDLPAGWLGKQNAMHLGVEQATGEYLCFTDADCHFICPDMVRIAVQFARDHSVDLLSILPVLEASTFWERVLQPVCSVVMMAWFRPEWINSPGHPRAYANGAFMLFRRSCYEAIGGHGSAKAKINEDMELARRTKAEGYRLHVIQNGDLYRTRMYDSLSGTFRGWSRIFYGCFARLYLVIAAAAMLMLMSVLPYIVFAGALGWIIAGTPSASAAWWYVLAASTAAIAAQLALIVRFYQILGLKWYRAVSYPLGALIVLFMLFSAMGKFLGGKIVWRGRRIKTGNLAV